MSHLDGSRVMCGLSRRIFLQGTTLILGNGLSCAARAGVDEQAKVRLRLGLVTDMHHADKAAVGTRYYRETLSKLQEAAAQFKKEKLETVVELGDFVDAAESVEKELGYLETIEAEFSHLCDDRHYVLGNHCVDTLTKDEFLRAVGKTESYYSFDRSGVHFIVLDSCFRSDGKPYGRKNSQWTDANIPEAELKWLESDLMQAAGPVIVLAHQRLDPSGNYEVRNSAAVREILQKSGKVRLVLQGHSHKNDLTEIEQIPYCTLAAMIEGGGEENNGYSILEILENETLRLQGFRRQTSYNWAKRS